MTARTIDSETFELMDGELVGPMIEATERMLPGQDGRRRIQQGYRGTQSTLKTISTATSAAEAAATKLTYETYKSDTVTIVDQHDQTHTNCFVHDVNVIIKKIGTNTFGPSVTHLLETTWTVEEGL